jgi:very-short-patch-repair endonuclease
MAHPRTGATILCDHCGQPFYVAQNKLGRTRFCSAICRSLHLSAGAETRTCQVCGKPFYCPPARAKTGGKFCSKECQDKAQVTSVERRCLTCGKVFAVWPSALKRSRGLYCSQACHGAAQDLRVKTACEWCGKAFAASRDRVAAGRGRFCSRACRDAAARDRVTVACAHCGTQFETVPSRLADGRGRFCSRDCYFAHCGVGESGPESLLRQALEAHGVLFERERRIGPYRCDFIIGNLAVEIDSAFWHGRPGVQQKDTLKDDFLRGHGLRVLRVSEEDVRDNPDRIADFVRQEVNSTWTPSA